MHLVVLFRGRRGMYTTDTGHRRLDLTIRQLCQRYNFSYVTFSGNIRHTKG